MKHIQQLIEIKTKTFSKELAILASMLATDWSKVPVDTLVLVGDSIDSIYRKDRQTIRYFHSILKTQDGFKFNTISNGATSKTSTNTTHYTYAIIYEQD